MNNKSKKVFFFLNSTDKEKSGSKGISKEDTPAIMEIRIEVHENTCHEKYFTYSYCLNILLLLERSSRKHVGHDRDRVP